MNSPLKERALSVLGQAAIDYDKDTDECLFCTKGQTEEQPGGTKRVITEHDDECSVAECLAILAGGEPVLEAHGPFDPTKCQAKLLSSAVSLSGRRVAQECPNPPRIKATEVTSDQFEEAGCVALCLRCWGLFQNNVTIPTHYELLPEKT